MLKKTIVAAIFLTLALIWAIPAAACEPCIEIMTLQEAATEADIIIVGSMINEGPHNGSGPDWITVQVHEVWKGTPTDQRIRVNSWDGMCLYGIPAERGQSVMLLEWSDDQYVTVNYGCAISQYPIQGESVMVDEQPVSIEDFIAQLGVNAERQIIAKPTSTIPAWMLIALVVSMMLGAALILMAIILIRRRRTA